MEKGSEVAVSRNSLSLSLSHSGEFCHREVGKGRNFVTQSHEREGILSQRGGKGKKFLSPRGEKGKEFCHPEASFAPHSPEKDSDTLMALT